MFSLFQGRRRIALLLFLGAAIAGFSLHIEPAQAQIPEGPDPLAEIYDKSDDHSDSLDNKNAQELGWEMFFRMLAALALVLALFLAAAYVFKRYIGTRPDTGKRADTIQIVGTKMLSGKRSLMLVRVRGQSLLLGLTPQSINCLTEIHEVDGEWAQPADTEGSVGSPFEQKLGKFVDQTLAEPPQ